MQNMVGQRLVQIMSQAIRGRTDASTQVSIHASYQLVGDCINQ